MKWILHKNATLAGMLLMGCGHFTAASAAVAALATAFCLPGYQVLTTAQTYTTSPTDYLIAYSIGTQGDFFDPDDTVYTAWYYAAVPVDTTVAVAWSHQVASPVWGFYSVVGSPAYVLRAGLAHIYMPTQDNQCLYVPP